MEPQVSDSSLAERNTTTGFSSQALMDSSSQMPSEAAVMAGHPTYSSEDLCSLEAPESFLSVDVSSYTKSHKRAANRSCSSLDYSIHCGLHRIHSPCSLEDVGSGCHSQAFTETEGGLQSQEDGTRSRSRSLDCCSDTFGSTQRDSHGSTGEVHQPTPRKMCCGVFIQPVASQTQHTRFLVPVNSLPHSCPEKMVQQHSRRTRWSRIVRSTSDPLSCSSTAEVAVSAAYVAASACQDARNRLSPTRKPKGCPEAELPRKPKVLQALCKERPHSLVDLQAYKDTKVLVARFLEHSNCSLPPEVRHVVNSIRSVIKSDERHMEEAIFSANVIDQVITSSQQNVDTSRKRLQEDLHLQSCGALSSPVAFLRRASVTHSLERGRPRSFIGVSRETVL